MSVCAGFRVRCHLVVCACTHITEITDLGSNRRNYFRQCSCSFGCSFLDTHSLICSFIHSTIIHRIVVRKGSTALAHSMGFRTLAMEHSAGHSNRLTSGEGAVLPWGIRSLITITTKCTGDSHGS